MWDLNSFYTETGAHFPQTLSVDVNFDKKYLSDPFAKAVSIKREKANDFFDIFDFYELKDPPNIQGFNGLKIIDSPGNIFLHILNFRIF